MPTVNIVKGFNLTHDRTTFPDDKNHWGTIERIPPGIHEFHEEMANHWFVLAHSDTPPAVTPQAGTPEFAAQAAAQIARRKLVELALEHQVHEAGLSVKQEALQSGRLGDDEDALHAMAVEEEQKAAEAAAEAEAARTGRKVALPSRRAVPPPT